MAETSTNRVVVLDDYISPDDVEVIDINPTLGLFPKAGREEAVYRALVNAHPRLKVYWRAETPEHWHYRDHPRIPPIVGVADEGWQVLPRATLRQRIERGRPAPGASTATTRATRSRCMASSSRQGPAFKSGVVLPPFQNIHVYDALARASASTPAKNDGDPAVARTMLK